MDVRNKEATYRIPYMDLGACHPHVRLRFLTSKLELHPIGGTAWIDRLHALTAIWSTRVSLGRMRTKATFTKDDQERAEEGRLRRQRNAMRSEKVRRRRRKRTNL